MTDHVDYEAYRKRMMEVGQLYEDFVRQQLATVGMHINIYSSKRYQISRGESPNGAEVKYDDNMRRTGNLWIELAEKACPRNGRYARSGVYRQGFTFYIQGDYSQFFIFPTDTLRCEVESGRYKHLENKTKTSVGILLPCRQAQRLGAMVAVENGHPKIRAMSDELRRDAIASMKLPSRQKHLF